MGCLLIKLMMDNVVQSAVTLITPQKNPDISDIPTDSGAIITRPVNKGYKEAVYKDAKGKTETFSGLCPHLGCQLQASAACSWSVFCMCRLHI